MTKIDDELVKLFLSFCSKRDVKFFNIARKKRNPEDYARLFFVSSSLGFRHFALFLYHEMELSQCTEKAFSIILTAKREGTEEKWIMDFLKDMSENKLSTLKN